MDGGRKAVDSDERQATTAIKVNMADSVAYELSRRTKARRAKNGAFSRNDLIREAISEYFSRHPFKDSPHG